MVLTLPVETVNYFAISEHSCDAHQNVGHTKRNVPLRLVRGEKRRSGAALCDIQHNHTRVKMLIIKGVSMVYKQMFIIYYNFNTNNNNSKLNLPNEEGLRLLF